MDEDPKAYRSHLPGCPLCSELVPVLSESATWHLVLNRNQNLLGKCMLVLRRHTESVTGLTSLEWDDLYAQIRRASEMLVRAFAPDHFNYAFLQNQDRHVHLHIIPRYAEVRSFAGLVFTDPDYPDHYSVPSPPGLMSTEVLASLADHLRPLLRVDMH